MGELSDTQLRAIVTASPVAIVATTAAGEVSSWNPAAERLFGWTADAVLGRPLPFLLAESRAAHADRCDAVLRGHRLAGIELQVADADGALISIAAAMAPLLDQERGVTGVLLLAQNVDDDILGAARGPRGLQHILDAIPAPIFYKDAAGVYRGCNTAFTAYLGKSREEIVGKSVYDIAPQDLAEIYRKADLDLFASRGVQVYESSVLFADGTRHDVIFNQATFLDGDGNLGGLVGTVLDITARKDAERALRASEEQYRAVVAALEEGIVVVSRDHTLLACNAAAEGILRRGRDSIARWVTGFSTWPLVHGDGAPCPPSAVPIQRTLETGLPASAAEIGIDHPDGSRVWISMNARPLFHPRESAPFAAVASFADITARRDIDARLQHQAFYDSLTGLPNRALFIDRLHQAVALAGRRGDTLAVACLDLDRFKIVNDTLGHEAGDHLLCAVAQRLAECARESDTVARMGGDEFMMILPGIHDVGNAVAAARRVLAALRPALEVAGHELSVSASIGVTVYPTDGEDVGTLMRNADRAMYRAKEAGKDDVCAFAADDRDGAPSRLAIESQLRRAIERGELRLDYQPQIDLASGDAVAVEALLRWHNRELGAIAPAHIIPIAEETGLIVALGEWVLLHACGHVVEWMADGHPAQRVAVNVSPVQFRRGDFAATVGRALRATGLPASLLELELTENLILRDVDVVVERIAELHDMGVSIALDDFGVGTSSLAYLQRLPIDTLKIDRSFVRDLESSARRSPAAIVQPLIALAHGLGMTVVAEGVESLAQLARLRALGCDRAQGFAIAAPARSMAQMQVQMRLG